MASDQARCNERDTALRTVGEPGNADSSAMIQSGIALIGSHYQDSFIDRLPRAVQKDGKDAVPPRAREKNQSSRQRFGHDFARHVRQPFIAAVVPISEKLMIEAEQMQDGSMKIMHVSSFFGCA